MRRSLSALVSVSLLVPAITLALDFPKNETTFRDAPFSQSETAAIRLLSGRSIMEGNPNGNFGVSSYVNRAEFAKISSLIPDGEAGWDNVTPNCFPDVPSVQWFHLYVCHMKDIGVLKGNPDGYYHPDRTVNYAEALVTLARQLGYDDEVKMQPGDQWFAPYVRLAKSKGYALPDTRVQPSTALTRGQVARLVAAAVAESEGALDEYRAAEAGHYPLSSSSSSWSSSSMSMSSSSAWSSSSVSSMSSSSVSSAGVSARLPVRSRFLMLGTRTLPIASLKFFADKEAIYVRNVEVKTTRKISSFDALFLVDQNGVQLGQLTLDRLADNTSKTWKGTFEATTYRIPKGEERVLAVEARLSAKDSGGISGELVEVSSFRLGGQGEDSGWTYNTASSDIVFPQHQTAQARITGVTNVLTSSEALPLGNDQVLAAFSFTGERVPQSNADLRIVDLQFQISKASTVIVNNWEVGSPDSPEHWPCSATDTLVTCQSIPLDFGNLSAGARTLRVFGDVTIEAGSANNFLQVSLNDPGSVGVSGAIHWSDGANTFNWVELDSPIARSTRFN